MERFAADFTYFCGTTQDKNNMWVASRAGFLEN